MPARKGYPPGVLCWVETAQPDAGAAAGFYGPLFGWEFEDRTPPGRQGRHLVGRLGGLDVAGIRSRPGPAVWDTWVAAGSADAAAARVRDAGGTVTTQPREHGEAARIALCSDPTGAVFGIWEARGRPGAEMVNAPGTWNWSDLVTDNLEAAEAFYGAVFGWQADRVDLGGGDAAMWRLPGYGDLLEADDPDLRRRQADAGVPAGFADAIGWLLPPAGDDPPHWQVTFAVDDTDATVELAAKLGAQVLVPPYDAGPARVALIGDPRGAVFSVSRYDP